jgi:uncharacterized protein YbgA (DUF1722 family)
MGDARVAADQEAANQEEASGRPRLGVSSCLLGEPVRFNGGHSRSRFLTDELGPHVDWVPYCPEMEIGLGTPRETLRLTVDGRLVSRSGAADHTAAMARLRTLLDGPWQPRDLVSFHARHKLQLLAHDPARYRAAGRVAAAAGSAAREAIEVAYRDVFQAAMSTGASRGRHANALRHAFSRIARGLDRRRRVDLSDRIESFEHGVDPLSAPMAILAHYASDRELPWLATQTYLRPYPPELGLSR